MNTFIKKNTMSSLLETAKKKPFWILFLFCFAVLFGPAFAMFSEYSYDITANPDIGTYLGLAEFDFNQSSIRRYRVIIPFLAAGIHFVFGPLFSLIEPWSFPGENFSLGFSFFIVNMIIMSYFGVTIFRLCKSFGSTMIAATIALLMVLTCRWAGYIAGLPLIDSLYLTIIGLTLLGIQTKDKRIIYWVIFLGPWAKESFIFIAPIIFFYAPFISKRRQVILFLLSGFLVFSFRYYFDLVNGFSTISSYSNDIATFNDIIPYLGRLFSFHGFYEVISVIGVWGLMFLFLIDKSIRNFIKKKSPKYTILFISMILLHALLSGEIARMIYLLSPLLAVWIALIIDWIRNEYFPINEHKMDTSVIHKTP